MTHDLGNFELKVNHRFSSWSFWRAIITCVFEQLHVSLCIFIGPKGECCFLFGSPPQFCDVVAEIVIIQNLAIKNRKGKDLNIILYFWLLS